MTLNTCSGVISFAKGLENESAKFYQGLSEKYAKDEDVFLSFVKENGKNIVQMERAYYEVISDALESGFAFNINPDEYTFRTELIEKTSYGDTLDQVIEMEETMIRFYSDAAEQSRSLMADVPRAFTLIAKKRRNRSPKLRSLLSREG